LANVYLPLDAKPKWFITGVTRIPETRPPPPWTYCAPCAKILFSSWLWAVNPEPKVFDENTVMDVSEYFDERAKELLAAGSQRVTDYRSENSPVLFLDRDLSALGAIQAKGGRIEGERFETGQALQPSVAAPVLAYSAESKTIFALTHPEGSGPLLSVWSPDGGWRERFDLPAGLGEAVALAITHYGEQLVLLARSERGGSFRFIHIDPQTGDVGLLGEVTASDVEGATIAMGRDGRLLLAISGEDRTELRHLVLGKDGLETADSVVAKGQLLGDVVEDVQAVRFTVLVGDTPHTRIVPLNEFQAGR
jgi:hypothetical protein